MTRRRLLAAKGLGGADTEFPFPPGRPEGRRRRRRRAARAVPSKLGGADTEFPFPPRRPEGRRRRRRRAARAAPSKLGGADTELLFLPTCAKRPNAFCSFLGTYINGADTSIPAKCADKCPQARLPLLYSSQGAAAPATERLRGTQRPAGRRPGPMSAAQRGRRLGSARVRRPRVKGGWWRRGGATGLGTLGGRESRGTWNETLYERGA